MENLLHYLWKHRLYASAPFKTSDGKSLEILDPGMANSDAGPDFFNAKIKLDGEVWAGNIEIHTHASDWYKHHHEKDKAYNSVILHVVEHLDTSEVRNQMGIAIPQWVMRMPPAIYENNLLLEGNYAAFPCLKRLCEIPSIYLTDWKCALTSERLERKSQDIFQLLRSYRNDWDEVCYITLARNFGFNVNSDAFEQLAKSLPLRCILKHSNSPQQVEALFLGQAGLLEADVPDDDYYLRLQQEYHFLRLKYQLRSQEAFLFKSLRMHPSHFPHIKVVQLAGFVAQEQGLLSRLLEKKTLREFQSLFFADVPAYWETHYRFGIPSPSRKKKLGQSSINILLINTVVPILFAYGQQKKLGDRVQQALDLLESIPSERNRIVDTFTGAGMPSAHAGDSQALIQLQKEYCERRRCLFCRIGHRLFARGEA